MLTLLAISLGVGVNVGVFAVVQAVLLRQPPYPNHDRVVNVGSRDLKTGRGPGPVSTLNYLDWRNQNTVFAEMAAWSFAPVAIGAPDGPREVRAVRVTGDYFRVFGARPLYGRTLQPDDEVRHRRVVVVSHRLWTSLLGADPSIVDHDLRIDGQPYVVIGVLPAGMSFDLTSAQLWIPLEFNATNSSRDFHWLFCVAELKRGTSIEQAQANMDGVARGLAATYPEADTGRGVLIEPEAVGRVSPSVKASLYLLFAVVIAVLVIACVNVTSVGLAEGVSRQREMAIRSALGAPRQRLIGQLLVENASLALLGGLMAFPVAWLTVAAIRAVVPLVDLPLELPIALNWWMLPAGLAAAVATGVVIAIAPAIWATSPSLSHTIAEVGGREATASKSQRRMRGALVAVEVALAFVMLTSAGWLLSSVQRMQQLDLGFSPDHVLTAGLPVSKGTFGGPAQVTGYLRSIVSKVGAIPGVTEVALTDALPMEYWRTGRFFQVAGHPPVPRSERPVCGVKIVTPSYRAAIGLRVLNGRFLTDHDTASAPLVTVINETFARAYFGNTNPVGQRILMNRVSLDQSNRGADVPWEVVGVIRDERITDLSAVGNAPVAYVTDDQNPTLNEALVIKTAVAPETIRKATNEAVLAVNADQPLTDVRTLADIVSSARSPETLRASLLVGFGLIALALAALGIYGIIAWSVGLRRREIGIRSALGATSVRLHALFLREVLVVVGAGVLAGLIVMPLSSRLMASVLFGVAASDPRLVVAVAVTVVIVAVAACALPVRHALKGDLLVVLRSE